MHPDEQIAKIASRRYGAFTHPQAIAAGFSASAITRRLQRGTWLRIHRGVYGVAGYPGTWEREFMAAYLACGPRAALSCGSAGRVWDVTVRHGPTGRPHVVVLTGRVRARPGVVVHRSRELDAVTHKGFRVTHPMRTLLDLSAYLDDESLEIALDVALDRRLVHPDRLRAYLALERHRERTGSGVLRGLVDLRRPGRGIASGGETKLFRFLRRFGLPSPVVQHPIRTRSGMRYVDFAYPDAHVALEFDGWEWHAGRKAFDRDSARRNELEELGWHVLQVTSTQMTAEAAVLASTIGNSLQLVPARWRQAP